MKNARRHSRYLHMSMARATMRGTSPHKGERTMLTTIIDHNTTKRKPRLKPADNYTIRLFPGLWSEIGLDPAILLAQLDYWTSTEATEHAGPSPVGPGGWRGQ